ncbi:response regulator [bacterium]|nr:response regulator [bacterium]
MREISMVSIVDDDEIFRFTTELSLKRTIDQIAITTFEDGEQAINFIKDHLNNADKLPDVIFLDINMPFLDGWGFLEEFANIKGQLPKSITIYISSSSMDADDIERARQSLEVKGYIVKPITAEIFERVLREPDKLNEFLID